MHLVHFQSILLEFYTDYTPKKGQLGEYFSKSLKPSLKLYIVKKGWELDGWDNLVKRATKAEVRACIINNYHLDQQYPLSKYLSPVTINKD